MIYGCTCESTAGPAACAVHAPFQDPVPTLGVMSLRDYFAAQALQGMLASSKNLAFDAIDHGAVSLAAYRYADAMLWARKAQ